MQYADYAAWEAEAETARLYENQLGHWRERLADLPEQAGIPTDRQRPELLSGTGASVPVAVPADLAAQANSLGASLFEATLTALALLIHRYNGEDRVVVGVPVANRPHPEWEPVVGYFANSLAVPVDVSGSPSLGELLTRVRTASVEALSHQNVPFDLVVEALGVRRHSGMNPMFQVMCSVNRVTRAPELPGLEISLVEARNDTAKFDLELAVSVDTGHVGIAFDYADDLFDRATVEQLAADYAAIVDALLTSPGAGVGEVVLSRHGDVERAGRPVELRDRYGNRVPTGVFGSFDGRRARVLRDGRLEFADETSSDDDDVIGGDVVGGDEPLTPTEIAMADIWKQVLGKAEVRRDWDFFSVGGDSLLATRVIARARRVWPVKLTVRHMLQHRLLSALADVIDRAVGDSGVVAENAPAERVPTPADAGEAPALSMAQRGIWIVNQLEGHGGYYHSRSPSA